MYQVSRRRSKEIEGDKIGAKRGGIRGIREREREEGSRGRKGKGVKIECTTDYVHVSVARTMDDGPSHHVLT